MPKHTDKKPFGGKKAMGKKAKPLFGGKKAKPFKRGGGRRKK